jgi:hypothetical protein
MVSAAVAAYAPGGVSWTANFYLEPEDAAGSTIELARMPPTPGVGYVAIREADDNATLLAESVGGQLTFQLHEGGVVEGEASTQPSDASATLTGKYSLSCWVLPQTLGQEQDGSGNGAAYVQDAAMTSKFCKRFKELL